MKKILLPVILLLTGACAAPSPTQNNATAPASSGSGDQAFKALHDKYVVEFLRRNPTVNTYLGGAGLDPSLRDTDGRLRDHSAAALAEEDRWLTDAQKSFEGVDAAALSPTRRIDREVALAQIRFQLHQHQVRRYQERALDTYAGEPFRAIDWQLQGMTQTGDKSYGTAEEWTLVMKRVQDIPRFLKVAQEQLLAGVKSGNTPDWRMLGRDGLNTSEANAKYFSETLPKVMEERYAPNFENRAEMVGRLREISNQSADAYREFGNFIRTTFFDEGAVRTTGIPRPGNVGLPPKSQFAADRFALGEEEYNWAIKNNLRLDTTAAALYDGSMQIVEGTRKEMMELARRIGEKRAMKLPEDGAEAVRAVFDELSKDYPKTDDEMVGWYRDACFRVVDYGRKTGVFDVPADYKLEVTITPPPLLASIDGAAYYPAPPFKTTGVGRFYVSPTGNDEAALKSNNRAALADLAVHEGFPGHDWHFKVMTQYKDSIAPVRWLTPGAVEDSSSMWEDSMASEGWALYTEALMGEPQQGAPEGFYTPEERLYQLQGKLYRDLRVRVDTGIHTNRMSYDEAAELFSEVVDFLPGKCSDASKSEAKRASCESAERAIFRYSKWPTQAITYRLGKDQIYALRADAARALGDKFSPKDFHVLFMKQGTIPAGYFSEELLRELQKK
ncbi:MAG: DUF885 domain-containing protein [Acidobacteria bacterium]|nr:DUF885 domain-containing protein [Acidobacteriota bacterium]